MSQVRIAHELPCSEEVFWAEYFFDEVFNHRLYVDELGFTEWRQLERDEDERFIRRVVDVAPSLKELPGPLTRIIGEGFRYREVGRFDKNERRYRVSVTSNTLGERLKVEGEMWCQPQSESSVSRLFEAEVHAKVFGVGRLLESRVIADMERSYDLAADFIRRSA